MTPKQIQQFQNNLLEWYGAAQRPMPWRNTQSPYAIWLAEIMLQQTTVATVIPYYTRFLEKFPTVESLAAAPHEEVLHLWAGLGYYRRAHHLHQCAKHVTTHLNGTFPTTEVELLTLPGLGPYTAAVVAATAFNQPATVVDGNVERVITRLFTLADPLPGAKPRIRQHATRLASTEEPRLYANAIMELGALVCTPKNPKCETCPVATFCNARKHNNPESFPVKSPKKKVPHHHGTAYVITDPQGRLYLRQRPATGLLANLWELPHTGWESTPLPALKLTSEKPAGTLTHTFSHFKLTLTLIGATTPRLPPQNAFSPTRLPPLSTLMKKALHKAQDVPV